MHVISTNIDFTLLYIIIPTEHHCVNAEKSLNFNVLRISGQFVCMHPLIIMLQMKIHTTRLYTKFIHRIHYQKMN